MLNMKVHKKMFNIGGKSKDSHPEDYLNCGKIGRLDNLLEASSLVTGTYGSKGAAKRRTVRR
jgi:hypothetical protein